MTNEAPQVKPAGRYSVTETCAILGVHRSTLRRWTMAGAITASHHKGTGKKFYTGREITRFWMMTI